MTRSIRWSLTLSSVCILLALAPPGMLSGQNLQSTVEVDKRDRSLRERQAETFLRLQEAKLKQAEALNRRVANTVAEEDIKSMRLDVELGKQLLASARRGEKSGLKSVYMRLAENAVLSAESHLTKAKEVRQTIPSMFSDLDMEVLQLKVEKTKLNLAAGEKALAGSIEDELRWKVDLLYEEVLRLRSEVKMLKSRR